MKSSKILILIILLFAANGWAATYYIDCGHGGSDSGTWANPYSSLSSLQSAINSASDGDDFYFVDGDTCTLDSGTKTINLDGITGTSGNRTIFGCASAEGVFTCDDRPEIDGASTYPDAAGTGAFTKDNDTSPDEGYITIENLYFENIGPSGTNTGRGVLFSHQQYVYVDNCSFYRTGSGGIIMAHANNCQITDNVVNYSNYLSSPNGGIIIQGSKTSVTCSDNLVQGNVVKNAYEGIGLYYGVQNTTVEKNTIYDTRSISLYMANPTDNILRYNLVYNSTSDPDSDTEYCIALGCEGADCATVAGGSLECADGNAVYNNLVAGCENGIRFYNNCDAQNLLLQDNLVYNNTFVDNEDNFGFGTIADSSGNLIKNNFSWTVTGGMDHVSTCSPSGFTWDNNFFDENPGTGNCDDGQINGTAALEKTSGWRSVTAGSLDGTEFTPQASSDAVDAGITLSGYNDRITASDFATEFSVSVTTQTISSGWDIGAWEYDAEAPAANDGIQGVTFQGVSIN